jgi:predicted PurR-regulated permease PerM
VLGGILAFGFVGIFLGPTLLAVGFRFVRRWAAPQHGAGEAAAEKK